MSNYGINQINHILNDERTNMHVDGANVMNAPTCTSCQNHIARNNIGSHVDHFLSEYYKGTSNIGWNSITPLFDINCNVMVQDKTIGNAHNLLDILTNNYVKRANYGHMNSKWIITSPDTVVVSVFGTMQFVSFIGGLSHPIFFSEIFVIKYDPAVQRLKCYVHTLDF